MQVARVALVLCLLGDGSARAGICSIEEPPDELLSAIGLNTFGSADFDGYGNSAAPPGGLWILGRGDTSPSLSASRSMPGGVCPGNEANLDVVYRARSQRILRAPADAVVGDELLYCEVIAADRNNFGEEACGCYSLTVGSPPTVAPSPLSFELLDEEPIRKSVSCDGETFIDVDRLRVRFPPELDLTDTILQAWTVPAGEPFAGAPPVPQALDLATFAVDGEIVLAMGERGAFDVQVRASRASDGAITAPQFASVTTLPLPDPLEAPDALAGLGCSSSSAPDVVVLALLLRRRRTAV